MKKNLLVLLSALLFYCGVHSQFASANTAANIPFSIEPEFIQASTFVEGLAVVSDSANYKFGYINVKGQYIVEPKYDIAEDIQEGMGLVRLSNYKWGFVDKSGKEIITPIYDYADSFSNGLAKVTKDKKIGYVNKSGKIVIKLQYDEGTNFSEGRAWVKQSNEKYSLIDTSGRVIVSKKYDRISEFSDGLAYTIRDGKVGFVNIDGKEAYEFRSAGTYYDFHEGLNWAYYDNGKWGMIDKKGNQVISAKYDSPFGYGGILGFTGGLAVVKSNNKWGYIDKKGNEIVAPQFQVAYDFSDGLGRFRQNNKYGYVDKTGKVVIAPQYADAQDFHEGIAAVKNENGDTYYYIDKTGNRVLSTQTSDTPQAMRNYFSSNGMIPVKQGQYYGYVINPLQDTQAAWAKEEIESIVSVSVVTEDMLFGYNRNITRADFSELIMNLISVKTDLDIQNSINDDPTAVNHTFTDTNDRLILEANKLGIVNGKGKGIFDPYGDITRQEAAVMLQRAANIIGIKDDMANIDQNESFSDYNSIATWAKDAVLFVSTVKDTSNNAIMGGTGQNSFSPQSYYTRQQAFVTINRLYHTSN